MQSSGIYTLAFSMTPMDEGDRTGDVLTRVRSISPINADRGPLMGRHRNIEILRVHRSDSENLQTESRNADRSPWVRAASSEAPKHRSRWDRDGLGLG
jgi:hypothetical protein